REDWESWILYMLHGVESTARQTIWIIKAIKTAMMDYKHRIRSEFPKMYSQDLLNNLFRHPYTKIEYLQNDLRVTRLTASRYLAQLTESGFLEKAKVGRYNYYINQPLMDLFADIPEL
ncbi:MAG: Fic family protein, partial [Candidatus Electrothrix sp. EH2]|nr:Fic family protein [Candidatus Electrothrix sp. EH2]